MSQQTVLAQYTASLRRAGLPYNVTVGPDNKVVFADGPYAGKEVGLPNFNNTLNGGQDVRVITGPDAQHRTGTAIAGPDQGQSVDMSQMPWWKEALIGGAFAAAPFALGSLGVFGGGGSAGAAGAGGTVTADLPVTGVAETVDPATGLVTSSLPSTATSAAASGGGFAWKQFLPSAISSGVQTIVGSLAARSAANQQKQAGQAAAQSFSPFAQGGLDAYNQMLAKYGIRPVSAPPGSIAQRPGMPPGAPMSPSPISQPIPTIAPPGAPMAAQPSPYTLASFGVDPTATPTASSFGGR